MDTSFFDISGITTKHPGAEKASFSLYALTKAKGMSARLGGKAVWILLLHLLFISLPISRAQTWQMKQAPIMTPWASRIDTSHVLPEYPRPQLVREKWMNLNGIWQFQPGVSANDAFPTGKLSGKILVPFPVESAISGVMKHYDRLWYKRTFALHEEYNGRRILLHFGAVDWECEVFINGTSVGRHTGGFDPFSFDITPYLTTGMQEIAVRVYDPTDQGGQPRGKQVLNPNGIWYTPVTGIWQTVWLEPVAQEYIKNLKIVPDIDNGLVNITVNSSETSSGLTSEVVIKDGNMVVASFSGTVNANLRIPVPAPKLWSPDSPFLYDLVVRLKNGNTLVDSVISYFGMRKVSLGTVNGHVRILLNNKFKYQFGPLDQGWWPDGLYTAPTDSALRWDIDRMKEYGFNIARKHIKVEPDRWYYWCDKLGLLVWQDMPSGNNNSVESRQNYEDEMRRMIENKINIPSIIMWIVFNEGWGQYDTQRVTGIAQSCDTTRLVSNASGWTDAGAGHILDSHSYPLPSCLSSSDRAVVNGEFGGIAYLSSGHIWDPNSWGYETVGSVSELEDKLVGFSQMIEGFIPKGLSASIYTQLTDVELEINGLITYDRKVIKASPSNVRKWMNRLIEMGDSSYIFKPILPTGEKQGQLWRYTTSTPPADWYLSGFDDQSWSSGRSGFGTAGTPGSFIGTAWNTSDIYMRAAFVVDNITSNNLSQIVMRLCHDENMEIYINGQWAVSYYGYTANYLISPIMKDALQSIKPGQQNVIAVHCHQTTGGQYADVGLYMKTKPDDTSSYGRISTGFRVNKEENFLIYPNPVNNKRIHLELPASSNSNGFTIQLTDSKGLLVKTVLLKSVEGPLDLDIPELNPGIYMIHIENQEKNFSGKGKIVICN